MRHRMLPACLLALLWTVSAQAATYYVSPSGNNARSGLAPDQAWQTIARVNAQDFAPGDLILFEGGHTFSGNLFFDAADAGTRANPVTISSYGRGRATIYAADGRGILVLNAAGFRISELFIVGSGRDLNTESGILFFTDLPGDVLLDGIVIDHVDAVRFGDYGIEIGSHAGRSGYQNVSISHVIASENGLGGVFTYADARAVHRNVSVTNSSAFLNAGFAGLLFNSGNGITLSSVDGGRIERCVAHDNGWRSDAANGPIGIWTFNSNNVVIQLNESYSNKTGGTKDGGGFSLDNSTSNSVLQYNYSHDNAGAGLLLAHKWNDNVHTGNVIRYNVSQNDARKNRYAAIHTWGRIRNAEIYNNTVYMTYSQGGQRAVYLRNTSIEGQDPEHLHIRNNIFQIKGTIPLVDVAASVLDAAVDVRLEGNVWWTTGSAFKVLWKGVTYTSLAAWRTATGQERLNGSDVGLSVDPQLTSPGTGIGYNNAFLIHDVWQYRLKATSPAIDAGIDLASLGVNVGPRDYFGAPPLRGRGDVGAHEYHGDCNWTLTPASASIGAAAATGTASVGMSAVWGCGWAATSNQSWAGAVPESGGAPGTFTWWAEENTGSARSANIRVANQVFRLTQAGPPPPSTNPGEDIVLWASDASLLSSGWSIVADTTAAGGQRLQNANAGAAKVVTPLAQPTQYVEISFSALAGRGYRLWMRGKALSNAATNDSVHVQFDRSVTSTGTPTARIGTTTSYEWNLEECSGCGLSGWGWQDDGWGVGVMGPLVYFETSGTQRMRIQVREDGVGLDQIVLSSVRWLNTAPGANKADTTILPKQQ